MLAWSMFIHSVRLVLNNLDVALRVSLVLYLVVAASQIANVYVYEGDMALGPDGNTYPVVSGGEVLMAFILGLAGVVASLWIAVAWHRFVLLAEVPQGWLPAWPPAGSLFGYLWRSILVGLTVAIVLMPVVMVSFLLGPVIMIALGVGVGSYVFFRLSPVLPAIALGNKMSFREALEATKPAGANLFGLAGLMIIGSLLLQLPTILSGDPNSTVSLIYGVVVGWLATMIGISLLTTVYGYYVEGRGID